MSERILEDLGPVDEVGLDALAKETANAVENEESGGTREASPASYAIVRDALDKARAMERARIRAALRT